MFLGMQDFDFTQILGNSLILPNLPNFFSEFTQILLKFYPNLPNVAQKNLIFYCINGPKQVLYCLYSFILNKLFF